VNLDRRVGWQCTEVVVHERPPPPHCAYRIDHFLRLSILRRRGMGAGDPQSQNTKRYYCDDGWRITGTICFVGLNPTVPAIARDVKNGGCHAEAAILLYASRNIPKDPTHKRNPLSTVQALHLHLRAFRSVGTSARTARFAGQYPMSFQKRECPVNGATVNRRVEFLRTAKDHPNIAAPWGFFHHLHNRKALSR
jgi:hypothetical protein